MTSTAKKPRDTDFGQRQLSRQQVSKRQPKRFGLFQPFVQLMFASAVIATTASLKGEDSLPHPVKHWRNAHAHNDYQHPHPLLDALDHGFCSVEVDVFLQDGELLVGHERKELQPTRTLERLYLAPLRERILAQHGRVYAAEGAFFLLIDIKSEGEATYEAVHSQLVKYAELFSFRDNGNWKPRAVTAVISGNVPREMILKQSVCYAGIDGRPHDLNSDLPSHMMPWISTSWNSLFHWRGEGPMPTAEKAKLRQHVSDAHSKGRLVRFWATAESTDLWRELCDQGVDLIGTDDLQKLDEFFGEQSCGRPQPPRNDSPQPAGEPPRK